MSIEINGCMSQDNSTWKESRIMELEDENERLNALREEEITQLRETQETLINLLVTAYKKLGISIDDINKAIGERSTCIRS